MICMPLSLNAGNCFQAIGFTAPAAMAAMDVLSLQNLMTHTVELHIIFGDVLLH